MVVGRRGCGKTTFLEKLGTNNFFGELVKTEWISWIDIDKKRETKIQYCFSKETEAHVAKEPNELDLLIETFKLFGENKKMDRLIVMNDVYGVADISKKIANFLNF